MKNKMLHRLRVSNTETQQTSKQKSAYGRFYDMYVKVHENVRYTANAAVLPNAFNQVALFVFPIIGDAHETAIYNVQSLDNWSKNLYPPHSTEH